MLEFRANLAERLAVRSLLFVVGLYLLALRAGVVVVVYVALPRFFFGLCVKRWDFGHLSPPMGKWAFDSSPKCIRTGVRLLAMRTCRTFVQTLH